MATNYDKMRQQVMAASMRKANAKPATKTTTKQVSRPGATSAYAGNKMTPSSSSGASAYAKAKSQVASARSASALRSQVASAKPASAKQTSQAKAMSQLKRANINTTSLKKKTY